MGKSKGKIFILLTVLSAGIALSIFLFYVALQWHKAYLKQEFVSLAEDLSEDVVRQVVIHTEILYALRSYYEGSQEVERSEFFSFTENFLLRHKNIMSIAWVKRVPDFERTGFEEAVRAEGYADFQITELNASGDLVKAGQRSEYFPLYYIEPFSENKKVFGFDMSSSSERFKAMEKSCDTEESIASGRLSLIQKPKGEFGYRIFLSVYKNGKPHSTIQERRDNLAGFYTAVFYMPELIGSVIKEKQPAGLDIYIFDDTSNKGELLYYHHSRLRKDKMAPLTKDELFKDQGLVWYEYYKMSGRAWCIVINAAPEFYLMHNRLALLAPSVLIVCLSSTVLLLFYLRGLLMHSVLIESLVEKRTVELKKATEEWIKTFNSISDLVFIMDTNCVVVKVNEAFTNTFKIKPEEVIGKRCFEFVHKRDARWPVCPCEGTLIDKKSHTVEVDDPNIGIPLLVTTSPVFGDKGELVGIVHIAKDITQFKEAERKLKEVIELKSQFISVASHELRTPLTAMKESIDIVYTESSGALNAEQKDFLGIAKRNLDRLARLINNILDFQKLETGAAELSMQENDINETVSEVQGTMINLAKDKGIELSVYLEENLPKVKFDKDRIIQVLTNIINNAIKFTDKGSIVVKTSKGDNVVKVSIEDTGPGIRKEDMPRLFQKFEQLGAPKDRKTGGTGLGLAISKDIIEKHKGKIWAESETGKGATFIFILPIQERRAA